MRYFVVLAIASILLPGCATSKTSLDAAATSSKPVSIAAAATPRAFFEAPPTFESMDVLDVEEACGELHFVHPVVWNDGYLHHHALYSLYGDFTAVGTERARVRLHEIAVTAQLEAMKGGKAGARGFGEGMKDTAFGPFRQVRKMLRNPLYAVAAVPGSIFKYADFLVGAVGALRHGVGKEEFKDLIGYKDAREDLAELLGVDPYTTNPALRQALNETAWGFYSGGLPIQILDDFMPGIPKLNVGSGGMSIGSAIDEVRPSSRSRTLKSLVDDRAQRKAFREHPWYTPETERRLLNALRDARDAEGGGAFIAASMAAASEDDAYAYMRTAEMIGIYCDRVGDIDHVEMVGRFPIVQSPADGTRALLVYADYVVWTAAFAGVVGVLEAGEVGAAKAVWVSGEVSIRTRYELDARGIPVFEHTFARPAAEAESA